jgi:hypothetical protein
VGWLTGWREQQNLSPTAEEMNLMQSSGKGQRLW